MSDITLEDVEVAIKVLEEFTRRYRRAVAVLRRTTSIMRYTGVYTVPSFNDIMQYIMQYKVKSEEELGEETEELTEEDLRRIREIKDKLKQS